MYKKYQELFDGYLSLLKKWYKQDAPIDSKKEICIRCNMYEYRLQGMLELMHETGEIPRIKMEEEWKRVEKTFSTKNLFGLEIVGARVYQYGKG